MMSRNFPWKRSRPTKVKVWNQGLLINKIDVLWITAGFGCNGDTIAKAAARQPSIESIFGGELPSTPKLRFYNPFQSAQNGDESVRHFRAAIQRSVGNFILVIEGAISNAKNSAQPYGASIDAPTGRSTTACEWIAKAPKAWAVVQESKRAPGNFTSYADLLSFAEDPAQSEKEAST